MMKPPIYPHFHMAEYLNKFPIWNSAKKRQLLTALQSEPGISMGNVREPIRTKPLAIAASTINQLIRKIPCFQVSLAGFCRQLPSVLSHFRVSVHILHSQSLPWRYQIQLSRVWYSFKHCRELLNTLSCRGPPRQPHNPSPKLNGGVWPLNGYSRSMPLQSICYSVQLIEGKGSNHSQSCTQRGHQKPKVVQRSVNIYLSIHVSH